MPTTIHLRPELLAQIDACAKRARLNRNQFIARSLKEAVQADLDWSLPLLDALEGNAHETLFDAGGRLLSLIRPGRQWAENESGAFELEEGAILLDGATMLRLLIGDRNVIGFFLTRRPDEIFIPQASAAELELGLCRLESDAEFRELRRRWSQLTGHVRVDPWDDCVTSHLGVAYRALAGCSPRATSLEIATLAHAIARKAPLVVGTHWSLAQNVDLPNVVGLP